MNDLPDDDGDLLPGAGPSERTAALHAAVRALTSSPCWLCGAMLCGHEAVLAILLGSRHAPRCAACAAAELREGSLDLAERCLQWIGRRECFHDAWRRASGEEGFGEDDRPACLFGARAGSLAVARDSASSGAAAPIGDPPLDDPIPDDEHDAGDLGCGDLVIDLKFKLAGMSPGEVLLVRATDPAAPIDLPAWCGLVGHTLLRASPPRYWIRRKHPS